MNVKKEIIAKLSSFPTIPVTVNRLLQVLNNQDIVPKEICEVIKYDPALTANILKAANSAFLGFTKPVESLEDASTRLGSRWIYQIAVSSLIYSNVKRPAPGYNQSAEDIWRHSIGVAVGAEVLSRSQHPGIAGTVFTAGLLHDIGKIALEEFVETSFDDIQNLVDNNNMTFEEAEIEVLGIDHAEIGAMIADHWHFPESIIECIRWHHRPDTAPKCAPAIDMVHIADALCLMQGIGIGRDGLHYHPSEEATKRHNISGSTLETVTFEILSSLEEIDKLLGEEEQVCAGAKEVN
jgi:putative nucleotidyltransferase with HDIG domain